MPYMDKTGPMGKGPRTGRGLGDCKLKNNGGNKMEGTQVPKGEMYDPGMQVRKAKGNTVADTPEKIVKNIL